MATKPKSKRPQVSLRRDMDESLERLSNVTGLSKVEILSRGLKAIEPKLIKAAKAMAIPIPA